MNTAVITPYKYCYDVLGNRTGVTEPDGTENTYAYDALSQLRVKVTDTAGIKQTTEYTYDRLGRKETVTALADENNTAEKQTTEYTYNNRGLITEVKYPNTSVTEKITYAYYPAGQVSKRTDQRGVITEYYYDKTYRLLEKKVDDTVDATENTVLREKFTWDAMGRMLSAVKYAPDGTTVVSNSGFDYYDNGRVKQAVEDYAGLTAKTINYEYDQAARRTSTDPSSTVRGLNRHF